MSALEDDAYRAFRRDLHRHPEPAWREFYTTARIVEELRERDLTELHVGPDALATDDRMNVPDDEELAEWERRAREAGADPSIVDELSGGYTGCVAVVERGDGPVIGLRVDIDALPIRESEDGDHVLVGERRFAYRISRWSAVGSPAPIDRWSLIAVPPLWILLGSIGSIGFKLRERVSLGGFQNFDVEFLYYLVHPDIFGHGGRRAQVVLGVVALLVIFVSLRRMARRTGGVA
jgi:hypothetical protein